MTAREGELKPCRFCGNQMKTNLPMLVKGQSMSAYGEGFYVECPQCRAKGSLERDGIHAISAWNLSANPRIAELEVENARLDKQNANLDSLLSSSIKLSDKHEAVNCDLHLRVEKLEAENAMLKQKLDESDALFHASLTGQSNALEEVEKLEGLLRECLGELMAVPRANRCNDDSMQDVIKRTTAALGGVTTRESKNA